ncbi:MAG: helix-turn-helix domain-containing protein [Rhodospirillaceae bacterium]|nr:helix-turn-helix domain-containing protein [Rhodospirillaceae bacterium]
MVERQESLDFDTDVLTRGGDPPVFCAIAGRQPWIDRISDTFFERSFEEGFRRSVEAFRMRERLSARAFGVAALGDPDLVEKMVCGTAAGLRLNTVDAVLGFMGEEPLGPLFECEVEAYLGLTGMPTHRLGVGAVGDASFVSRLREGESPPLCEADRVRRWMGLHSSPAQRRAIATATLLPQRWRLEVAQWPRHPASRCAGHGCAWAGARPRYLDTVEAAATVGLSPRTLEYYRGVGRGPVYFKLGGRVRYSVAEIERWVRARRRYSTRGAERAGPRRVAATRESVEAA